MSRRRKHRNTDTKAHNPTDFVHKAADLTDREATQAIKIIHAAQVKWSGRPNTEKNLDHMRDEILTQLASVNILASFDPTPCFYGEPPEIEIIGKVAGDPIHKYGFDHEQKEYEVKQAVKRNEDYRGQKE
jgi:hypothetical protein